MALPDFFPKTDPELDIGGPNGLLLVGQSFSRIYNITSFNGTVCADEPTDFTGFNLIGEVVDGAGVVLDTFTVTPSAGDTTGSFLVELTPAQVTIALRDSATQWKFRMVDGGTTNSLLILANFKVT